MRVLRTAFLTATIAAIACGANAAPSTVKLSLYAQNRPGETATVTLNQVPGGVTIAIEMAGGQNGTQPVHIHTGTCAKLSAVASYTLTDIVHGNSTTTISGVSLDDLLDGKYVIDIHESSADTQKYVACAAIVRP